MRAILSGVSLLILGIVIGVTVHPDLHGSQGGSSHPRAVPASARPSVTPSRTVATPLVNGSAAASATPDPDRTLPSTVTDGPDITVVPPATLGGKTVITVGLGDSITYIPGSWFRRTCGSGVLHTCHDAGIRGDTTTGMLARFDRDVLTLKPSIVTVMGGSNDLRDRDKTADIVERLDQLVTRVHQSGAVAVLCTVPPRNHYAKGALALNAAIRRYAAEHHLPLLDMYSAVGTKKGKYKAGLSADGIHPNARGAAAMEAVAEKRLPKLLHPAKPLFTR